MDSRVTTCWRSRRAGAWAMGCEARGSWSRCLRAESSIMLRSSRGAARGKGIGTAAGAGDRAGLLAASAASGGAGRPEADLARGSAGGSGAAAGAAWGSASGGMVPVLVRPRGPCDRHPCGAEAAASRELPRDRGCHNSLLGAGVHGVLASLAVRCNRQGKRFVDLARSWFRAPVPHAISLAGLPDGSVPPVPVVSPRFCRSPPRIQLPGARPVCSEDGKQEQKRGGQGGWCSG
jgi:hypothetical protein